MNLFHRRYARGLIWLIAGLIPFCAVLMAHRVAEHRRAELARVREQRSRVEEELRGVRAEQAELSMQRARLDSTPIAEVAAVEQSRAPSHKDTAERDPWSSPPSQLPFWNPASPYVWLRKDAFTRLPATPITRDGALEDPVADALSITPAIRNLIHQEISDVLERQQEIELEQAKVRTYPGAAGSKAPARIEVEIPEMSELNSLLRESLEKAIRTHLGEARGTLLAQLAASWLEEQFSVRAGAAKLYTVIGKADGTYEIRQAAAGGSSSSCCNREFESYIPAHLRSLFKPMQSIPPE